MSTTPTSAARSISLPGPTGWPTPENFATAEVELPALEDGQILVRNIAHLRRPVHARPDERRQVVRPAVPARTRPSTAAPSARSSSPTR